MSHYIGEIHYVDKTKKELVIIIRKTNDVKPIFTLASLTRAKPYQYDSLLCIYPLFSAK